MKSIFLVTGGLGHLGSTIVKALLRRGGEVRALILPTDKGRREDGVEYFIGDVRRKESMIPFFEHDEDQDLYLIHTAGLISIQDKGTKDIYAVNVGGTKNIIDMAKKYGVQLVVRSSLNDHEGTIVKEETSVERMLISGVALDRNTARISVIGLKDEPGMAFKLFNMLAKENINVDVILQSIGRENSKDISFTVSRDDADTAVKLIEDNMSRLGGKGISCRRDVAKVSIVGAGMMSNPGVAAKMFEALYNNNININMISTSEIRVTVLIDERDAERAVNAVHDAFGLEE